MVHPAEIFQESTAERECTWRGVPPVTTQLFGTPVILWRGVAKPYGARVLIDGAQTVAHIPVNVQELGCDFYVFLGHKIFGPTGIGVVYAKRELLEIMPPWQGSRQYDQGRHLRRDGL